MDPVYIHPGKEGRKEWRMEARMQGRKEECQQGSKDSTNQRKDWRKEARTHGMQKEGSCILLTLLRVGSHFHRFAVLTVKAESSSRFFLTPSYSRCCLFRLCLCESSNALDRARYPWKTPPKWPQKYMRKLYKHCDNMCTSMQQKSFFESTVKARLGLPAIHSIVVYRWC